MPKYNRDQLEIDLKNIVAKMGSSKKEGLYSKHVFEDEQIVITWDWEVRVMAQRTGKVLDLSNINPSNSYGLHIMRLALDLEEKDFRKKESLTK